MVSQRMFAVLQAKAVDNDVINYGKSTVTIDAGSMMSQVLDTYVS